MIEGEEETCSTRKACATAHLCGLPQGFAKKANAADRAYP